jgi:chromosome segregation ATPase
MTKDTKSGAVTVLPSANIREQLRATEEFIRALKQDLNYYRTQTKDLQEERGELLGTLSRMDALKGERTEQENEQSLLKSERDRLSKALRSIEAANEELKHRCLVLETALVAERKRCQETQEVIVCLEEQIAQLESIVDLLREHEEIRRAEEQLEACRREQGGDQEPGSLKE